TGPVYPWAPAYKRHLFVLTRRDQLLIEDFRAAIGVDAQRGKRDELASLRKRGQHRVSTFREQRETFGPAGGEIGQRQGVQKPPIEVLTTMSHQVHFHKAGAVLLPLGKGAHWDLGFAEETWSGRG